MNNIADQLTSLNDNLGAMADLIGQIKEAALNLPEAGGDTDSTTVWEIYDYPDLSSIPTQGFTISFTSNGARYEAIRCMNVSATGRQLIYTREGGASGFQLAFYEDLTDSSRNSWSSGGSYRRIVFHEEITDESLLSWLNSNAKLIRIGNNTSLVGSYAVKNWGLLVGQEAKNNTYHDLKGIYSYFYDPEAEGFTLQEVDCIEINDATDIWVYSTLGLAKYWGSYNDEWWDSYDLVNDAQLLIWEIPELIKVSQDFYELFMSWVDDGSYPFDCGYNLGWEAGNSEGLEALGVLCDWSVMTDNGSIPSVYIINYHPSYYLRCRVFARSSGGEDSPYYIDENGDEVYPEDGYIIIAPGSDFEVTFDHAFSYYGNVYVEEMRWTADGTV